MRLGIMQPYFFPYLGYFDLIARSDRWVVYDTAQDIKHGWVHRNRILHPKSGWQYITVPRRKHPLNTEIRDVRIVGTDWKARITGQVDHYRKSAPNFQFVRSLLDDCLAIHTDALSELNVAILQVVCDALDLSFAPVFASSLDVQHFEDAAACEKVLHLCETVGAIEYINPPGGASLYDAEWFRERGVKLTIQQYRPLVYDCGKYEFEPGLSVLDALMWVSPEEIRQHLLESAGAGADG